MKRKIVCLLLVFALCMGLSVPTYATVSPPTELKNLESVTISLPDAPKFVISLENLCDYYMVSNTHRGYQETYVEFPQYTFFFSGSGTFTSNKQGIGDGEYAAADNTPWGGGAAWFQADQPLVIGESKNGEEYLIYIGFDVYSDGLPEEPNMVDRDGAKVMYRVTFYNLKTGKISDFPTDPDTYKNSTFSPVSELTVKASTEKPSSWAEVQVNTAISANLVPMSLQSKYTQVTTRAEFCALAVALYESILGTTITERNTFNDTNDVNVQKMGALGVVTGVGNGNFAPDDKLTREQAAIMLTRLANALGKPLTRQEATFADNSKISSWAIESIGQIQTAGIMKGVGNNAFAPQDPYSREQSMITILRLYDSVK